MSESKAGKEKKNFSCLEGQTVFIPEDCLGALESIVLGFQRERVKRRRQVEFNRIEHVLKDLRFVDREAKIVSISFGCIDVGELGMFVTTAPGITRARIKIPEAT